MPKNVWTGLVLLFSAGSFLYVAAVHVLPDVMNDPASSINDAYALGPPTTGPFGLRPPQVRRQWRRRTGRSTGGQGGSVHKRVEVACMGVGLERNACCWSRPIFPLSLSPCSHPRAPIPVLPYPCSQTRAPSPPLPSPHVPWIGEERLLLVAGPCFRAPSPCSHPRAPSPHLPSLHLPFSTPSPHTRLFRRPPLTRPFPAPAQVRGVSIVLGMLTPLLLTGHGHGH